MKRRVLAAVVGAAGVAAWVTAQPGGTPAPLAGYFPGGAALYLEARDFAGLLRDWNGSAEKQAWLKSANYEEFSRSRLLLRLREAQGEFAAAARLAPDMALVNSVAGKESALAIYDIGKLEFLYVSRLTSAAALTTALWQARSSYEGRSAAGKEYFVRADSNGRVASFASTDGLLLLSTREDLMAGALALIAGQGRALTGERWFEQAVKAGGGQGELRMVLNFPALVRSPHFRSYWIQRNTSELRQYLSGVADFTRSGTEWREERAFVREQAGASRVAEEADTARVAAWAPEDLVLRRAWARPSAGDVLGLVRQKVVAPGAVAGESQRFAPQAMQLDVNAGDGLDLETRIDQPPLPAIDEGDELPELRRVLGQVGAAAMLHVQTSRRGPDGTFVGNDSAIAVLGSSDWPAGLQVAGAAVRVDGRALVIASTDALAASVASRVRNQPGAAEGIYSARYLHREELPRFEAMMRMIDQSRTRGSYGGGAFFSGDVASLGRVLGRLESHGVAVRDDGAAVRQRVVYRLAAP